MIFRKSLYLMARSVREGVRARSASRGLARGAAVELAGHGDYTAREAFVQAVSRRGGQAVVAVLLADGSDATARLDVGELDWLDVRAGDIVFVRRGLCGVFSG
jgi:hypothetical protein